MSNHDKDRKLKEDIELKLVKFGYLKGFSAFQRHAKYGILTKYNAQP
jgi:hypothetical protein